MRKSLAIATYAGAVFLLQAVLLVNVIYAQAVHKKVSNIQNVRINKGFSENIPDPETFFGHKPGADFKLIRWEKIYEYFRILGKSSERIRVQELGKTTMGNPFILAVISSPNNLAQLEMYKEIAAKLAKGRISEADAVRLAEKGKTIALVTCSMHASECGPTQMSPELGYVLATDDSPQIQKILDEVIFLLVPSWNPDGNILTTDWYRQNVGTAYETAPMP